MPSASDLLLGIEAYIAQANVSVTDGYPAPIDGWEPEQSGATRDQPRVYGVMPIYIRRPLGGRVSYLWQLGFEVMWVYPKNKASRAVWLVDAPIYYDHLRAIVGGLAALSQPITGVSLARDEAPQVSEIAIDDSRIPAHVVLSSVVKLEFELE